MNNSKNKENKKNKNNLNNSLLDVPWFDKYKPKTLDDLICHREHISIVSEWLNNFDAIRKEVREINLTKINKASKIKATKGKLNSRNANKNKTQNNTKNNTNAILDNIVSGTTTQSNAQIESELNKSFIDDDSLMDDVSSDEEYNEYEEIENNQSTSNKKNSKSLKKITDKVENKESTSTIKSTITISQNKTDTQEQPKSTTSRAKKNKYYGNMLIKGKHGIGKTVTLSVILDSLGYEIHKLNLLHVLDKVSKKESTQGDGISIHQKKLEKYLLKLAGSSNIMNSTFINNETKQKQTNKSNSKTDKNFQPTQRKFVVFVDELEIITSTNEKKIILDLLKINNEHMCCPIILVSNEKHNKLANTVVSLSKLVKFNIPNTAQLNEVLIRIFIDNKMKICREAVNIIVQHSQNDIRRLILIAQDLYYAYGVEVITTKKMEKYLVMTCKKETDPSLYEAAEALIYDYQNIFSALRYYNAEKVMLPLMVHYNYIDYVIDKYPNTSDQFDIALKVSNSLCQGDIISNYIYNDQQWDLQRIYGIYSCVEPSYILNENSYEKNSYYPKHIYESSFSMDLHKTSAKKQNIKKMNKLNKDMDNLNINDCIFVNKLLDESIKRGTIEKFVELLKEDYDIKYELIDSIYKIDKLFVNKKTLDVKTQTRIKTVTQENKEKVKVGNLKTLETNLKNKEKVSPVPKPLNMLQKKTLKAKPFSSISST